MVAADRHRRPELEGALQDAGIGWRPVWRDGPANAHDVSQYRRLALDGAVRATESTLMAVSLEDAVLHSGPYGETLNRDAGAGRAGSVVQPAQSMVRAIGSAVEYGRRRPARAPRLHIVGGAA